MEDPNRLGGRALMELVGYSPDDDGGWMVLMMELLVMVMPNWH